MSTHEVPGGKCPACGHEYNLASNADSHTRGPKPGDLTICDGCMGIFEIQEDMSMGPPKPKMLAQALVGQVIASLLCGAMEAKDIVVEGAQAAIENDEIWRN